MKLFSKVLAGAAAVVPAAGVLAQTNTTITGLAPSDVVSVFQTSAVPYIVAAVPILFVLGMAGVLIARVMKGGKRTIPRA